VPPKQHERFARSISLSADLHMATTACIAAIARYPKRNIALRHGADIIKRYDVAGFPRPDQRFSTDQGFQTDQCQRYC
jgi:hypothetical protein